MNRVCVHGYVSGRVQGVWYRGFVRDQALQANVAGWAKNLPDGRVEVLLCGAQSDIDTVVDSLHQGPPLSRVDQVDVQAIDPDEPVAGFSIL